MHNTVKGRKTGNFADKDGYNEPPRRGDGAEAMLLKEGFEIIRSKGSH